jgi:hypothetical protein
MNAHRLLRRACAVTPSSGITSGSTVDSSLVRHTGATSATPVVPLTSRRIAEAPLTTRTGTTLALPTRKGTPEVEQAGNTKGVYWLAFQTAHKKATFKHDAARSGNQLRTIGHRHASC